MAIVANIALQQPALTSDLDNVVRSHLNADTLSTMPNLEFHKMVFMIESGVIYTAKLSCASFGEGLTSERWR
jgi:hypothetical protein